MKVKKYQTPFSPIWKMELDNSNARIPSLPQIKILAEQQRKAKVVEAASKGDRLAQEELKKDRKEQYRKAVSNTRKQNNVLESSLTRTIDAFAEALIDREVDQLNMPKLVDQGVIEDADKIERAKTLNAINNGGYFWTTGNGFNYTPNYWTPEGLQAIELQFTTNAVNTAAGLSSGFMGPALQTHGFVPLLLSVGGGYAGNEAGSWLTSLFTDNPYWQGAGGFAGMLLGGGLGFKTGLSFLTPEQQLALLFQKATGVNYWNPTSSLVGRYINGLIQPIPNEILQLLVLGSMHNPITKTVDANGKIRFRLPSHTQEQPKEVVLVPHGNNKYEVHIRTWDGDHIPANITPQEKMALLTSAFSFLPEGAELMFPESSIEYPATRGTVAALQHASRDPRFLKGTPGTLIYTDKDGSLQTYTGTSLIKRLTKPAQVLELQYPGQRIYFGYFGPKHSINEVVNPDGTVNVQKAMQIANRAAYEHDGIRMLDRLENPEWHKTDPNTFLHTKEVAQRAWQMPTPAGYTKQDQMFAALGHDFGKMFAGDNHAQYGADYLRQVFPDMTDAQYRAIAYHMMSEDVARMNFSDLPLLLATMEADRGEPLFKNQLASNTIVYTGVPQKYVDNFENYNGEIWAGPTFESVLKYAKKHGNTFIVQYDPDNVRVIEIDAQGRLSVKGARKTDVPSDILDLYNEAGIMESPAYMSLYNLSKFANKIGPTVIKVKNVKDSSGKVFDYTIIGENVPRKIIKKIKNPSRALYDMNLSKIPLDLIYPTSEPNLFIDNKYHFITLNELDPGKFNKEWSYETIRRLNNLGYDTDEVTTYPMEYGTRVTSPGHYIIENGHKRLYLGYDPIYDNYSGVYLPKTDKRYMNLLFNRNVPSTVFHEQNMHGTDRIIELMEQYYGGKAKSMYTDVLDKMFKGINTKDLTSRNSDKWYEFRATLGEVMRNLHYRFRKEGSIADNIGKFETEVDNLSDSELLNILNSISTYGADYAKILKAKPELIPEIKHLLKYAPAVMLTGYGLDQYVQLNKHGNKLIRRNEKKNY